MKKNTKAKSAKKVSKPVSKKGGSKSKVSKVIEVSAVPVEPKTHVKNSVGISPLGDRVVVKALSPEESGTLMAFGIVIPDSSKEKPEQGIVVAVGPGKRSEDGSRQELSVQVGDKVMFSKYGFDEVKVGGVEYLIVPESSILAIIQ